MVEGVTEKWFGEMNEVVSSRRTESFVGGIRGFQMR